MSLARIVAMALLLPIGSGTGWTQEQKPEALPAETQETPDFNYLPAPFDSIRGNLKDLEETGYFVIEEAATDLRINGGEGLTWTLRVARPITCRHAEMLLRQIRDVRFYRTLSNGSRVELLSGLLQYADRIVQGAANDTLLKEGDVFDIWIELSPLQQRQLVTRDADRVIFRRPSH